MNTKPCNRALLSSGLTLWCLLLLPFFLSAAALAADEHQSPQLPSGQLSEEALKQSNWWAQVQKNIAESEYHITWQEKTVLPDAEAAYQAPNRAHNLRTYFTQSGPRVVRRTESSPSWLWGLELIGYGHGCGSQGAIAPAPAIQETRLDKGRIEYDRGGLIEWYVNDARGLEQGFTIKQPPGDQGLPDSGGQAGTKKETTDTPVCLETGRYRYTQMGTSVKEVGVHPCSSVVKDAVSPYASLRLGERIILEMAVRGDLTPRMMGDAKTIEFLNQDGVALMHYGQLTATDATGKTLPVTMNLISSPRSASTHQLTKLPTHQPNCIRLRIDAQDAVYPITVDPFITALSSSPDWTKESNQDWAEFGWSVATAGDVNGDGYSEVIVGAPYCDYGQTDEGAAWVYHGSASGLSTIPAWTKESNQVEACYGYSVATAGDVNGDGYSDVIVGAYEYHNGEDDEGRAFVYYGSADGLLTTATWSAESNQEGAQFGFSVATAGDVNGDGYSDVIVGAHIYTNDQMEEGRAFVYHGSSTGLPATADWTAESNQVSAFFGVSVATAGDVNGDGYSEVIVGAWYYDNGEGDEGRAFVYHGSAVGLSATAGWTAESNQAEAQFGFSVATAGDVNGDGYSDVIVGAYFYDNDQGDEGRAYVYYGSAVGLSATADWAAEGNQDDAFFGVSVAPAGDVNGDGYSDVIVGACRYSNGETNEGGAFVYQGSAVGLSATADWSAESDQAEARFGFSVATAGDVNGDGYSDVVVGAPVYTNGEAGEGGAFVYQGSAAGLSATADWAAESNQESACIGWSVATAGDVNGDGYSEVIVGAYYYDNGEAEEGGAFVYQGSASGLSPTAAWTAESNQAYAHFGISVATAGDVNGDGYSDVIVGAYMYSNGEAWEGRAYVYHGSAAGLSPTAAWTAESNQADARFGYSVATAGDVNGDGYSEVIVGAWLFDNGEENEGRAFVYHGSASGLSATADWTAESNQENASFGNSVATAGDVNGDGYSDVIVGAVYYENGETWEGRAYVYHGSADGLLTTATWTAESNQAEARFGNSVATAGDVNGDGYSEVIVGAYRYDNGETNEGRAFVYHGSATGLSGTADWIAEGNQAEAEFGWPVATAGDVNSDGYSDVIVGAHYYDNGEAEEGGAFVYQGSASGLSPTAAWTAESNQVWAEFGRSVATAGDVNGDGYSEVIVGVLGYDNGQTNEGGVFVYYGNGDGLSLQPQQRRADDSAPIAHLGKSDSWHKFRLAMLARSAFGRGKVKLEWEVKPLGTLFDGTGTQMSSSWTDLLATTTVQLNELVSGLSADTVYHWRERLRYHPATTPFQPCSRWVSGALNGWNEADLRTAPPPMSSYDFETDSEGWSYRTPSPTSVHVSHWANCSCIDPPAVLGIESPYDETTNYFAFWDSYDATPVPYVADALYQGNWYFSTNRASTNSVPSLRFRIGLSNQKAFAYSRAYPGDWLPLAQSPGITTYQLFFDPPIAADGLFLAFAMIDFIDDFRLSEPAGHLYLEEVSVYAHELSSLTSWTPETLTFLPVSWSQATAPPYDAPSFSPTTSTLSLQSGINASFTFGSWDSPPSLFSVAPGELNRLTLTLASDPQLGGPDLRVRVNTDDFRYAWYTYYVTSFTAGESALPAASGEDYALYLTLPFSTQPCRMSVDLIDFSTALGGSHTLSGALLDTLPH